MPGYTVFQPKNGSSRKSPYYRVTFTVGGEPFNLRTGERDPVRADIAGARLFLEEHERARIPVPREALGLLRTRGLAEISAMFLARVEEDIKLRRIVRHPRFATIMKGEIKKRVLPRFQTIDDITSTSWRDACVSMHDGYPKRKDSVSWRTIQRITVTARALVEHAHELGLLPSVPKLPAPSNEDVQLEQADRRGMTEEEWVRFIRALRQLARTNLVARRALRIYVALYWTALRKSALESLCLRQIDWSARRISLPPRKTKNKKQRSIALADETAKAIKAELGARGSIKPDEPIFGAFDFDNHHRARRVQGIFWSTLAAAEIDPHGLTAHHFTRHTAASIAGNRGATLAQLMALGTWDTPSMAMRYMHEDAEQSRAAQELLRPRVKTVRRKRGDHGARRRSGPRALRASGR